MSKHFKSRFTSGPSESSSACKANIEFFQLLKDYMKKQVPRFCLNMPETVIINCPGCDSVLFYIDSDGFLSFKEQITSEYVHRFLKRCYYFHKPPFPMIVYKLNRGNSLDYCKSMESLKESYALWKKKAESPSSFALQRFVIPPSENVSKIRIAYYVQKGLIMFRVVNKNDSISSHSPSTSKRGWTRLRTATATVQTMDLHDKYFIRGRTESGIYENELRNDSLQEQMKNLRKIIESAECADESYVLLEILADFIQDFQGVWFFLNVVNYKTEFVVNKKPKTGLPLMRRSIFSRKSVVKSSSAANFQQNSMENHSFFLSTESLLHEAFRELATPKQEAIETTDTIYRKAYHLKLSVISK